MKKTIKLFGIMALSMMALASCGETSSVVSSANSSAVSSLETPSSSETPSSNEESSSEPIAYGISITTDTEQVYLTKTLQMEAEVTPEGSATTWSVDNSSIATIDENGLLTPVKAGEVNVTVTVNNDSTKTASKKITVKDSLIDTSYNTDEWDYSQAYQDNPIIKTAAGDSINTYTAFRGVKTQNYMITAHVKVTNPSAGDTWSRIGLGNLNAETSSYHGMFLSPGSDFNARKYVMMDISATGDVGWGIVTDRSQVWNQHGLAAIDFSDVKLTTVRRESKYYYFVNDSLFYYDESFTDLNGIDSIPAIMVSSTEAEFSQMTISTDTDAMDTLIAGEGKRKLYASYADNVVISENDTKIQFLNADSGASINIKDNAAKSIGDAFTLPANKAATINMNFTVDAFGGTDGMPAITVNLNRHDNSASQCRSFVIGENKFGFTGWDTNGNLPAGIGASNDLSASLVAGTTYKATLNRLMTDSSQDCSMTIATLDGTILGSATWGWTSESDSTGVSTVWFATRNLNATLTDIAVSYPEA